MRRKPRPIAATWSVAFALAAAAAAISCRDDPREPVEAMLERARQRLSTDDYFTSPRPFVGAGLESWEALGSETGNERKLRDLEAEIARKEAAVPIIEQWLSDATEKGLRVRDGMGPARSLEAALDAIRADIAADKALKLELIDKLDEGSTWLRYALVVRDPDGEATRKECLFRVDPVGKTFLITEVRYLGGREREPETPERTARRYAPSGPSD